MASNVYHCYSSDRETFTSSAWRWKCAAPGRPFAFEHSCCMALAVPAVNPPSERSGAYEVKKGRKSGN